MLTLAVPTKPTVVLVVSCRTEVTEPIDNVSVTGTMTAAVVEGVNGVFRDRLFAMEAVLMLWLVTMTLTEELFEVIAELGILWLRLDVAAAKLDEDLVLNWLRPLEVELDDPVVFG